LTGSGRKSKYCWSVGWRPAGSPLFWAAHRVPGTRHMLERPWQPAWKA